jgi:hypothetical protein
MQAGNRTDRGSREARISVTDDGPGSDGRKGFDPVAPGDEVTLGDPYHLSRAARTLLASIALILVVTMTALFITGVIHW